MRNLTADEIVAQVDHAMAETGVAGVAAWLALGNATAMDEQGAIHPLARMQWCERMRSVQRPAIGCGQ